jgi:hypothetical protein
MAVLDPRGERVRDLLLRVQVRVGAQHLREQGALLVHQPGAGAGLGEVAHLEHDVVLVCGGDLRAVDRRPHAAQQLVEQAARVGQQRLVVVEQLGELGQRREGPGQGDLVADADRAEVVDDELDVGPGLPASHGQRRAGLGHAQRVGRELEVLGRPAVVAEGHALGERREVLLRRVQVDAHAHVVDEVDPGDAVLDDGVEAAHGASGLRGKSGGTGASKRSGRPSPGCLSEMRHACSSCREAPSDSRSSGASVLFTAFM